LKQKGRLLVVSNRLPVTLSCEEGKWKGCPASGGLVSAMNPVLKNRGGFWAGWPGTGSSARLADIRDILGPVSEESGYRLLPVMLTEEDVHDFYHGYSNSVLWPLFHDLQSRWRFFTPLLGRLSPFKREVCASRPEACLGGGFYLGE
jgi:Trehalose-6-phosphate synthase